jgi:hypothetical protein
MRDKELVQNKSRLNEDLKMKRMCLTSSFFSLSFSFVINFLTFRRLSTSVLITLGNTPRSKLSYGIDGSTSAVLHSSVLLLL